MQFKKPAKAPLSTGSKRNKKPIAPAAKPVPITPDTLLDTWLDKQDVLQKLHISARTLQNWRNSGLIPYSVVNNKFYYNVLDINQLLLDGRITNKPKKKPPKK